MRESQQPGPRRIAREIALQALYQYELTDGTAPSLLAGIREHFYDRFDEGVPMPPDEAWSFAGEIVAGVLGHLEEIDTLLRSVSRNWRLERMARVDRNVLRMGAYEMMYRPDIPRKVTINEAVEIAKRYGTTSSGGFVNGILDRVAKVEKP